MSGLAEELQERLAAFEAQGLRRRLAAVDSAQGARIQVEGRSLLNFSSNDYLGLANDPILKTASACAVERFGAGAGASRLLCGSLTPYHELEESLAAFKGTEAALVFSSGYATALGTIPALVGKDDLVVVDKLVHACIVDAARLSGAKLRVFAHNDVEDLESILAWGLARAASKGVARTARTLVITESLFSMDGDQAPLRDIVQLKERCGAWLMVDEAHATGLFGERRRGLAEAQGVADRIDIHMGTLGKALGAAGGYICGSRALIDFLVNRARSFLFSTAPVPAAAAAAEAGVRFVQSDAGERRCAQLWARIAEFRRSSASDEAARRGPIIPLHVGDETEAVDLATRLRERGLFIPAIRYPTVARRKARLRLTLSAAHTAEDVQRLRAELTALGRTL
jgi:8-amino-7-oxononanoate synthase